MKKLLYLFLVLPLVFSSCKKEDPAVVGCMDNTADNYNSNATEESSNSCTFSAEVVYFLFKSASDAMIASGVPYVGFYDNYENLMGIITYEYYYNSINDVPCSTTSGTLHSGITWSGNSNTNGANFVYNIYLDDGSLFATGNFDVNAGECMKVGFVITKSMAEEMLNR